MDDQVTLEAYAEENRALIHNGRSDEAIAICKHILHYYPKHIDSYRQLGEAFLEKEELDHATDMFRRVLSADPENVVAYVGLASIFEQQHLIDEAVWHLERANEISPGNFEIQKELLRMYSEAGKPRQRLKLTAGGLARLYDQEGLYAQAIQELRAIATASPARFDARIALAETLWHAGRIRESAEVAHGILNALPYCLKANLIVGTAWEESGLPDSETFLKRAQEVDPTNKVAARLFGSRSPLSVTEVYVPRYVEGKPSPAPVQPLVEEPAVETTDFFAEATTAEAAPPAEIAEPSPVTEPQIEPTVKPELPGATLPPWLVSEFPTPGETPSITPPTETGVTEQAQPTPSEVLVSPEETPLEPNETGLPAWLAELRQAEQIEVSSEEALPATSEELGQPMETVPETMEEDLPSWLAEKTPAESAETPSTEEVEAESGKLPAWMEGAEQIAESESSAGLAEEASAEHAEETPPQKLPAWMEYSGQPEAVPLEEVEAVTPEPAKEVPDWLRALQNQMPSEEVTPAPQEETAPIEDYVVPDFLASPAEPAEPLGEQTAQEFPTPAAPEVQPTEASAVMEFAETPREPEPESSPAIAAPSAPPIVVEMATEPPAPAVSKRKRQPKGYPHLVLAREHRDAHRVGDALVEYDWLVQHAPRLVKDVIDDLEALTARADAPLEAHRILGDAYTRVDRLSDALQRYQYVLERTSASS